MPTPISASELARRETALRAEIKRLQREETERLNAVEYTSDLDILRKLASDAETARSRRLELVRTLREVEAKRAYREAQRLRRQPTNAVA